MTKIPIQNIYYIALYAWNKVRDKDRIEQLDLENIETINDVIIDLFLMESTRITRKGLYGSYLAANHETEFIKGKINVKESIRLTPPTLNCRYDEFSQDHLTNQLLKATLRELFFMNNIKEKQKKKARKLLLSFQEVSDLNQSDYAFQMVQYNRLNKDYEFALDLAYLIYQHSIPTEDKERKQFIAIDQNEERMSAIFEEFLRNFYRRHTDYPVRARYYRWDLEAMPGSGIGLIPRMETDVEIEKLAEKIIMDAKYYQSAFTERFDNRRFISENLYQITAYLRKNLNKEDRNLRGILIYPTTGFEFHEKYRAKEGYQVELKSINLNQDWWKIERDLLHLIT